MGQVSALKGLAVGWPRYDNVSPASPAGKKALRSRAWRGPVPSWDLLWEGHLACASAPPSAKWDRWTHSAGRGGGCVSDRPQSAELRA